MKYVEWKCEKRYMLQAPERGARQPRVPRRGRRRVGSSEPTFARVRCGQGAGSLEGNEVDVIECTFYWGGDE